MILECPCEPQFGLKILQVASGHLSSVPPTFSASLPQQPRAYGVFRAPGTAYLIIELSAICTLHPDSLSNSKVLQAWLSNHFLRKASGDFPGPYKDPSFVLYSAMRLPLAYQNQTGETGHFMDLY